MTLHFGSAADISANTRVKTTETKYGNNMNTSEYIMTIQIGRNVTDIIALPCVDGVRKSFGGTLIYQVNTFYNSPKYAREGDYICKDHDGKWHVEYNHQEH